MTRCLNDMIFRVVDFVRIDFALLKLRGASKNMNHESVSYHLVIPGLLRMLAMLADGRPLIADDRIRSVFFKALGNQLSLDRHDSSSCPVRPMVVVDTIRAGAQLLFVVLALKTLGIIAYLRLRHNRHPHYLVPPLPHACWLPHWRQSSVRLL